MFALWLGPPLILFISLIEALLLTKLLLRIGCPLIVGVIPVVVLLVVIVFADKLILTFSKSRGIQHTGKLSQFILNISYRTNSFNLTVYRSSYLPKNVYLLKSIFGGKTIIFGGGLAENYELKDLEGLIKKSLMTLDRPMVIFSTIVYGLYLLHLMPLFLLKSWKVNEKIVSALSIGYIPFSWIVKKVCEGVYKNIEKDESLKDPANSSTVFQISQIVEEHPSWQGQILAPMGLVRKNNQDLLSLLMRRNSGFPLGGRA